MELLVTITVVGILMAIAAPSFRYVTTANRASSEINALLGDMQMARGEAMKEGQFVTICASSLSRAPTPWPRITVSPPLRSTAKALP